MKKLTLIAVLISMMTINAQAQWFDFSVNPERAVVGLNVGIGCYDSFGQAFNGDTWAATNFGVGACIALAGAYVDFMYVSPDHSHDPLIVQQNWDDHDAFVLNFGYQIPIYENYVFITPVIGWSRISTGYTIGNSINIDNTGNGTTTFHHNYNSTWHSNELNYGGGLTIAPSKYFEINVFCTNHASYAGVAFNFMNFKN